VCCRLQLAAARSKATDRRIAIMNEIISAIRVIKFFAWTQRYRQKAQDARKAELDWSVKQIWNSTGYVLVWTATPILVSCISFALFILVQKGDLTVSVAFTSVSLFAQLRMPVR
jgi:ABC-type multidrug transport system fused ATPase/permease subunit